MSMFCKCPILPLGQQSCRCWCMAKSNPDSKGFDPEGWREGALDGQPRGQSGVLPASSPCPHHRYTAF